MKRVFLLIGVLFFMSSDLRAMISFPHICEEISFDRPLYPISKPREEGLLKASETHTLFYALYGNPDGIPVIVLHGGPGAGCMDMLCQSFDLSHYNVIMFDQRGAMRSEPFGCMEENTPEHTIADIETLRNHLGIKKWVVFGGSWGSLLGMLYGEAHPESCIGFILRGVWLGRKEDFSHLLYGMGKTFPEAYQPVINYIPKEEHHDLISAYYRRVFDPDPEVHMAAARIFMRFDFTCSTHLPSPAYLERIMQNDKLVLSVAKAFFYYAMHDFFLKPNQILSHMERVSHLPAIIINGRYDTICPPEMAYSVHQNWANSKLWIIPEGGHTANELPIGSALCSATDVFAESLK
jgi:proline iminopeptidase